MVVDGEAGNEDVEVEVSRVSTVILKVGMVVRRERMGVPRVPVAWELLVGGWRLKEGRGGGLLLWRF